MFFILCAVHTAARIHPFSFIYICSVIAFISKCSGIVFVQNITHVIDIKMSKKAAYHIGSYFSVSSFEITDASEKLETSAKYLHVWMPFPENTRFYHFSIFDQFKLNLSIGLIVSIKCHLFHSSRRNTIFITNHSLKWGCCFRVQFKMKLLT